MPTEKLIRYYAHTGLSSDGSDWQTLLDHLLAVGTGAAERANVVDRFRPLTAERLEGSALLAGWLHDLGKYRKEFQDYLFKRPVEKEKRYHKQAGAAKTALLGYSSVAFAIAGHHGGLPNASDLKQAVLGPSGKLVCDQVWDIAVNQNPGLATLSANSTSTNDTLEIDFLSRLILSCLVDADWEDTANYKRALKALPPEPTVSQLDRQALDGFLHQLMKFIELRSSECLDENIKSIRAEILGDCLIAATRPRGCFTLTVPTGGGKTLSSMAFALRHAIEHHLRRIVYIAPYLSIIDQNTKVLRDALTLSSDDGRLFAHHSLAEPPDMETDDSDPNAAARRAENWDAPFVVSTNIQFFESLFSNKPSKVRKLHNLAGSVIILDECQSLPPGLTIPTCAMLRHVSEQLGCTIVFCTATQPVFDHRAIPELHRICATEIIAENRELFDRLKRVQLSWPSSRDERITWQEIARIMRESHSQRALCIVNTRRAARELFQSLQAESPGDVFHLSTNMCAMHRLKILRTVKRRLDANQPCFLVSTQLIEAGIDVDFPLVLREMAPLDSIIQAAGRCNREGRLKYADGSPAGVTRIFRSQAALDEPKKYFPPDQWYKAGRSTLENNFLEVGHLPSIDRLADIREYFDRLFSGGQLDEKQIHQARMNLDFPAVAHDYKLIDDDSVPVVIGSWEKTKVRVEWLLRRVHRDPSRANFRRLAPYQVNVRRSQLASETGKWIEKRFAELDLFVWCGPYHDSLGMSSDSTDLLLIV